MIRSRVFKSIIFSVLLVTYVLLSCPFSVSASELVPDEDGMCYEYDENGDLYATHYFIPLESYPSRFSLSKPQFDEFYIDQVPWSSFPSYIRAIAFSSFYNTRISDHGMEYYRSPFIMVTTNGDTYTIRAGWDVGLFYRESSGSATIGFTKQLLDAGISPKLYMATFDVSDNSVVSSWTEKEYGEWSNSGKLYNFSGSGINHNSVIDVYMYGVNVSQYTTWDAITETSYVLTSSGEVVWASFYNFGKGFLDMPNKGFPALFHSNAANLYISAFEPQSSTVMCYDVPNFGLSSTILQSPLFLTLNDAPYGLDSSVLSFWINQKNSYHFFTDSSAETYFFRNWAYSDSQLGKLTIGIASKSPIYRIGYTSNGSLASVNGASGLTKCENNFSSGSTSWHKTMQYFVDEGYYVFTYNLPAGNVGCTISRNSTNLIIDPSKSITYYGYGWGSYPTIDYLNQFILQEQNSILDEQNSLIGEGNEELSGIHGELTQSGDSNFSTTLDDEALSDYNEAESDLVDDYNPDNLEDDLNIEIDGGALSVIFNIMDKFIKADSSVFALIISCLSIGIISLLLGR